MSEIRNQKKPQPLSSSKLSFSAEVSKKRLSLRAAEGGVAIQTVAAEVKRHPTFHYLPKSHQPQIVSKM
jgi:hypothetical protein